MTMERRGAWLSLPDGFTRGAAVGPDPAGGTVKCNPQESCVIRAAGKIALSECRRPGRDDPHSPLPARDPAEHWERGAHVRPHAVAPAPHPPAGVQDHGPKPEAGGHG